MNTVTHISDTQWRALERLVIERQSVEGGCKGRMVFCNELVRFLLGYHVPMNFHDALVRHHAALHPPSDFSFALQEEPRSQPPSFVFEMRNGPGLGPQATPPKEPRGGTSTAVAPKFRPAKEKKKSLPQ